MQLAGEQPVWEEAEIQFLDKHRILSPESESFSKLNAFETCYMAPWCPQRTDKTISLEGKPTIWKKDVLSQ